MTMWDNPVPRWGLRSRLWLAWRALLSPPECVRFTEPHQTRHLVGFYMPVDYQ